MKQSNDQHGKVYKTVQQCHLHLGNNELPFMGLKFYSIRGNSQTVM